MSEVTEGEFDLGSLNDEELTEMEADDEYPLSDSEKEIVAAIRAAIVARGEDYVYVEYC